MVKKHVLDKFPSKVVSLAIRGVYTLYEGPENLLVAADDGATVFVLSLNGAYLYTEANVDLDAYEQLHVVDLVEVMEQLESLRL